MTTVQNIVLKIQRHLAPALILAVLFCLTISPPVAALDLNINPSDYFQLTYDPITFNKGEVVPGEVFHTTIKGRATCSKNIPLPVSRAAVTLKAIARQATDGSVYTINPGFTIEIDPFPNKKGETFTIDLPLDLQFPSGAAPGDYSVIWQTVEARAKIGFFWTDVTGYLPPEQAMGNISVITATTPPPAGTMVAPASASSGAPSAVSPTPTTTRSAVAAGTAIPLWILPLLAALVAAAVIFIVIFLAVRRKKHA